MCALVTGGQTCALPIWLEGNPDGEEAALPEEWLKAIAEKYLSPEEMEKIKALGWDEVMETLKKRLEEQKEQHHGGNKWIGTGGTSPFGNSGYNPAGVRIGGEDRKSTRLNSSH